MHDFDRYSLCRASVGENKIGLLAFCNSTRLVLLTILLTLLPLSSVAVVDPLQLRQSWIADQKKISRINSIMQMPAEQRLLILEAGVRQKDPILLDVFVNSLIKDNKFAAFYPGKRSADASETAFDLIETGLAFGSPAYTYVPFLQLAATSKGIAQSSEHLDSLERISIALRENLKNSGVSHPVADRSPAGHHYRFMLLSHDAPR